MQAHQCVNIKELLSESFEGIPKEIISALVDQLGRSLAAQCRDLAGELHFRHQLVQPISYVTQLLARCYHEGIDCSALLGHADYILENDIQRLETNRVYNKLRKMVSRIKSREKLNIKIPETQYTLLSTCYNQLTKSFENSEQLTSLIIHHVVEFFNLYFLLNQFTIDFIGKQTNNDFAQFSALMKGFLLIPYCWFDEMTKIYFNYQDIGLQYYIMQLIGGVFASQHEGVHKKIHRLCLGDSHHLDKEVNLIMIELGSIINQYIKRNEYPSHFTGLNKDIIYYAQLFNRYSDEALLRLNFDYKISFDIRLLFPLNNVPANRWIALSTPYLEKNIDQCLLALEFLKQITAFVPLNKLIMASQRAEKEEIIYFIELVDKHLKLYLKGLPEQAKAYIADTIESCQSLQEVIMRLEVGFAKAQTIAFWVERDISYDEVNAVDPVLLNEFYKYYKSSCYVIYHTISVHYFNNMNEESIPFKGLFYFFHLLQSHALLYLEHHPVTNKLSEFDQLIEKADYLQQWLPLAAMVNRSTFAQVDKLMELIFQFSVFSEKSFIRVVVSATQDIDLLILRLEQRLPKATVNSYWLQHGVPYDVVDKLDFCFLQKTHAAFKILFEKSNLHAAEQHQESYDYFMYLYGKDLFNLYALLSENALPFIKSFLGMSVLKLERFLRSYSCIPEIYFSGVREILYKDKCFPQWINFFKSLSLCINVLKAEKILAVFSQSNNLKDCVQLLDNKLYLHLLGGLKLNIVECTQKRIPLHIIPDLTFARSNLSNKDENVIYELLLKHDIHPKASFYEFITDSKAENQLHRDIAVHNQGVLALLKQQGIDVDTAFHYDKKIHFEYTKEATSSINQVLIAIMADLNNIVYAIDQINELADVYQVKDKIKIFQKKIESKKRIDDKNTNHYLLELKKSQHIEEMRKIIKAIRALDPAQTSSYLIEHTNHLHDHLKMLIEDQTDLRKGLIFPRKFYAEMWDKSKVETFLLGNYLSCCLATDGAHFAAMVQRRMDVGMFMHVMIDEESGLPVAGNWLFFGNDINDSTQIYVVANFFEINNNIGRHVGLRDFLVSALLYFTGEYAEKINAKGFLIAPLTYGLIPDLTQFEEKNFSLKKVGEYLKMTTRWGKKNMMQYYLKSLDDNRFYLYDETKISEEHRKIFESGNSLLTKISLFRSSSELPSTSLLTERSIARHS